VLLELHKDLAPLADWRCSHLVGFRSKLPARLVRCPSVSGGALLLIPCGSVKDPRPGGWMLGSTSGGTRLRVVFVLVGVCHCAPSEAVFVTVPMLFADFVEGPLGLVSQISDTIT
jgi:hypothetical protein